MDKFIPANLYLTRKDIVAKLKEIGVEDTEDNIKKVIKHIQNVAYAWADAALDDLSPGDFEEGDV